MKKRKKPIIFALPDTTDREKSEVAKAIESGWLTRGPRTGELESRFKRFVLARDALALNSATSALHLALLCSGAESKTDGVLLPSITFAATAATVLHAGATPLLSDVDEGSLLLTPEIVADFLHNQCTTRSGRPVHKKHGRVIKAIVCVDLAGLPCDVPGIRRVTGDFQITIISDAAHSAGALVDDRPVGSLADATAFSFYATKNMTTGEGGMLTSRTTARLKRARLLSLHGIHRDRNAPQWQYDIREPGFKYNMNDIQAAMGLVQLDRLPEMIQRRKEIVDMYNRGLADLTEIQLPTNPDPVRFQSAHHLYSIRLSSASAKTAKTAKNTALKKRRLELHNRLAQMNVQSSVHFLPLHWHSYYRNKRDFFAGDRFPVADRAGSSLLSLPLHSGLTDEEVSYVIEAVRESIIRA